ncbi:MAG: hypothetical protein AB7O28_25395 [Vicinamibacterales bacterium]
MANRRAPVTCLLVVAVLGATRAGAQDGAESPQAAVAAWQRAAGANDWGAAFAVLLPAGRPEMARDLLIALNLAVAMADPDDPILKDPHLPEAESARKRQAFAGATGALRAAWRPYGMEGLVGAAPLAPGTRERLDAALAAADVAALMRDTMAAFTRAAPAIGLAPEALPRVPPLGAVTRYAVAGDRATARDGSTTVDFVRTGGRWYLAPPPGQ